MATTYPHPAHPASTSTQTTPSSSIPRKPLHQSMNNGPSHSTPSGSTSMQAATSSSSSSAIANATASSSKKRKISPPAPKSRLQSVGADQTDDDNVSITSKAAKDKDGKRARVHFSCVECHRRKQKCDRKEPCSQCVARRVPHLCRPFLNGVEDTTSADVQARLGTIETLLSRLVSALPSSLTSQAGISASSPPSDLTSLLKSSGDDVFHPGAPATLSSLPSDSADAEDPNKNVMPHRPPPSGQFPANISHSTPAGKSGYGWGLREGRLITLSLEDNPDLKEVLVTLKESGISKSHLEWLIAGVPGRRMADALVELYFRDIDWTRYKINKPSFMKRYNIFFDSIGRNPTNPKVDGDTLRWLPLMFVVLAIAALSAPNEIIPVADQASWSRRFYGSGKSSLEYAKALQRDNLDVLFAGLLASRYMLLTRRPAEGSTPLTTAFQLGLYRDGTILNLADKRDVEIRRRAWAMLYHLDRTVSLLVGRPASISDAHTDTKMPANLDDDELEGDFDPNGWPLTKPTTYTYVILRHKLAEIMGKIAFHTFAIQLPDYQTVLSLDKELLAWRETLPPFFRITNPDVSFDKTHPYLFVQRHLLQCEWFYTRITLNRPYLLRRKPQDSRYSYSKDAAIESATADLLSRRAFVMEKGNLIVNSGGYRVLNSYMVLGVTIKLDPDSPQADKLRHLLNVVSGRAPDSQGRISEPLVKEELAIVEFLTAKAAPTPSVLVGTTGNKTRQPGDETPVDLLLGLAKTRSGRRAAEEEKRQLRQQAAREAEEAKNNQKQTSNLSMSNNAVNNGGPGTQSPWGYQAPNMPGLDVQQPFDQSGQRKEPKPLQPPTRRPGQGPNTGLQQPMWSRSPEINFNGAELIRPSSRQSGSSISNQNQGGVGVYVGPGTAGGSGSGSPNNPYFQNNNNQIGGNGQNSPNRSKMSISQGPYTTLEQAVQHHQHQQQNQQQTSPMSNFNISPYQTLSNLSPSNSLNHPSSNTSNNNTNNASGDPFGGGLEQFLAQNILNTPPMSNINNNNNNNNNLLGNNGSGSGTNGISGTGGLGEGNQQFGNSLGDYDFSNLGLDLGNGGFNFDANGGFNPFALAATEEGRNPDMSSDDETQLLNYILNTFANSQPDGQ